MNPRYLDERLRLVHSRCVAKSQIFSAAWVVLGFFAGFYPSRASTKLLLFAAACVPIILRLLMLAHAWEVAQPDEVSVAALIPLVVHHVLGRSGGGDRAPVRLSVELVSGCFHCVIGSAFVGLCLGLLTRSKLDAQGDHLLTAATPLEQQLGARQENDELPPDAFSSESAQLQALRVKQLEAQLGASRAENARLQSQAFDLENARRQALIDAKLRRRTTEQRKSAGTLETLDESDD